MKIWIKYIAGVLIGLAFALVAPHQNASFTSITEYLSDLVIQFGRYSLYPFLFFGFTLAVFELRENRTLLRLGVMTGSVIIITTIVFAVTGLISVLIRNPSRIPIFVEGASETVSVGVRESILQLFPSSAFEALTNGLFILPLCVFAGFVGAGCAVDKTSAKATLTLFDSLSRVAYSVMTFFVDVVAIGMIALSVHWILQFREMISSRAFTDFIILLLFMLLFSALVLFPAIIRLTCGKGNPYRILYAGIAPALAAFFSGDANMALPILFRHVNESLGVRRRVSSITLPLFSVFARPGTALTVTISFIVILKSYSSRGIAFSDMFWLLGVAILLSFLLGRIPFGGAYIALAAVCALYGRGFEAGYLILRPAAFFIASVAAAIDALAAVTGSYIISKRWNQVNMRDLKFFI